jgi:hypothetical protein
LVKSSAETKEYPVARASVEIDRQIEEVRILTNERQAVSERLAVAETALHRDLSIVEAAETAIRVRRQAVCQRGTSGGRLLEALLERKIGEMGKLGYTEADLERLGLLEREENTP